MRSAKGGFGGPRRYAERAQNIQLGLERIYDHMSTTGGGSSGGVQANCHAHALRVRCVRHIIRHTQSTSFSGSIIGMSLKVSKELQCDCCGLCQYTILTYQACLYCCMFTTCRRQTKKIERGGAQSCAKCCAHPRGTVAPFWCSFLDGKVI